MRYRHIEEPCHVTKDIQYFIPITKNYVIDGKIYSTKVKIAVDKQGRKYYTLQATEGGNPALLAGTSPSVDTSTIAVSESNVNQNIDLQNQISELDSSNPVYTAETININGTERTVYNSNGDRIAQSETALRAFYAWFSDSKVVNTD